MICGKCRFSASTPATAVWATDWALTPDEGVTSTPRACNSPKIGRSRPAEWICTHFRSEEHTSELQSLMRISYAVFCLKKKSTKPHNHPSYTHSNKQFTTHSMNTV